MSKQNYHGSSKGGHKKFDNRKGSSSSYDNDLSTDDKNMIKDWIGGELDSAMVTKAEKIGSRIAVGKFTGTQFRNLFNEFRSIQKIANKDENAAYRKLLMFKPKLAYMEKRNNNNGARILRKILEESINHVTPENFGADYKNFMSFTEAVFAYHYSEAQRD